jgi:hypothetical protein
MLGAAMVAAVAVFAGIVEPLVPASALSSAPAYAGDFPDPFVLRVGPAYWAYATGTARSNLQVVSSTDLRTWSQPGDPLPHLPVWAAPGSTWAPGVLARLTGYVMYYTVRDRAAGRQCISVATSLTPGGPFVDRSSGPFICQLDHGGSIDPDPFVSPNGTPYLMWKSDDNALGNPSHLWAQRLSSDGLGLIGPRVRLLDQTRPWQLPVVEGPAMVAIGSSFVLLYGAGAWDSASSGIGYATCASPLGPCTNASVVGPWLASHGAARGPSGPAVFVDGAGQTRLAYAAWTGGVGYRGGGVRSLWLGTLSFRGGRPALS